MTLFNYLVNSLFTQALFMQYNYSFSTPFCPFVTHRCFATKRKALNKWAP